MVGLNDLNRVLGVCYSMNTAMHPKNNVSN